MNGFVDSFLKLLVAGQEDIIDYLNKNLEKLSRAEECIDQDNGLGTNFKKTVMFFLSQNYHFDYNSGIERRELINFIDDGVSEYRATQEFEELEKDGYIKRIKNRPITYVLDTSFMGKL